MKIEATASEILALIQLAEHDRHEDSPLPKGGGRNRLASHLPGRLLDRYQLLLRAGRTRIVVALERGSCSGCHLRLPTMVESNTRRSPAIHTCPHCQRMLYVREHVPQGPHLAEKKSDRRTGAPSEGQS